MSVARIAAARLANQLLTKPGPPDPAAIVSWFGAVQAQEYGAARWALGLRMRGAVSDAQIGRAIDDGQILRTHVMRPTWHFVAAADIRWLLALTAPHVHRKLQWGHGQLGTDASVRRRATTIIERALADESALTRPELAERLARANVAVKGTALALVVIHAELEGVICSGPRHGKLATYALLERRAPHAKTLPRDEALAELTTRYFRSHGPATVRDFVWWSGLATADAKRGLEIVRARAERIGQREYWSVTRPRAAGPAVDVHLLPVYDEYFVAYRDLDAVPRGPTRWGILPQAFISGGQVAGVWKTERGRDGLMLRLESARRLTRNERGAIERAVDRYARFHGSPITLTFA